MFDYIWNIEIEKKLHINQEGYNLFTYTCRDHIYANMSFLDLRESSDYRRIVCTSRISRTHCVSPAASILLTSSLFFHVHDTKNGYIRVYLANILDNSSIGCDQHLFFILHVFHKQCHFDILFLFHKNYYFTISMQYLKLNFSFIPINLA